MISGCHARQQKAAGEGPVGADEVLALQGVDGLPGIAGASSAREEAVGEVVVDDAG